MIFFTKSDWTSVSWNQIKASLPVDIRYVGGLMLVSLAGIASVNMDSWFVRWFYADDAIFAHYVIGARKIPFISALLNAAASALLIQLGKQFSVVEHFPFDGSWEWKDESGVNVRVSREVASQLLVELNRPQMSSKSQ